MKRNRFAEVFACLLLLTMISGAVRATAEGIDLSALTDDEIVALQNRVTAEFVERGIEKTATLARGAYIAGDDLPAGKYLYTCLAKDDDWGNVTVYSDRGEGNQLLWNIVSAPEDGEGPDTLFITLNEGDQLESGVAFSLTIMKGILFR